MHEDLFVWVVVVVLYFSKSILGLWPAILSLLSLLIQCSVTCGQGKVTRQILCVDYNDQSIDRNECDAEDILATEQDCSMPSCQQINPGNRPANPFPYPDYHQKNNRGGHPNRNQGHGHGGNQWRTGPWGAVSSCWVVVVVVLPSCKSGCIVDITLLVPHANKINVQLSQTGLSVLQKFKILRSLHSFSPSSHQN